MVFFRRRPLPALVALSTCALFIPAVPAEANTDHVRDGWCEEGEGQSVVVDWTAMPEAPAEARTGDNNYLIRCLVFDDPDNPSYTSTADPRMAVLEDAGISVTMESSGLVNSINGFEVSAGSWHYSGSDDSLAWNSGLWQPDPSQPFVGITAFTGDSDGLPSVVPQYADPAGPGPDEPGPDDPGPDDPGTDDPGPDNPGPDNPAPTDPPETQPPATQPPATQPPATQPPGTRPSHPAQQQRPGTNRQQAQERPEQTRQQPRNRRPQQVPGNRRTPSPTPTPQATASPTASPTPTPTPASSSATPPGAADERVWGEETQSQSPGSSEASGSMWPWIIGLLAATAGAVTIIILRRRPDNEDTL